MVNAVTRKVKYPVVVIGSERVGKTSIINRYCKNVFEETYFATLFSDLHIKRLVRNDIDVTLDIWDIGGQEQYKIDRKIYLPRAYVVIVVFAVDDVLSFMSLNEWMKEIKEFCKARPRMILVANKIDLRCTDPNCIVTGQIENEASNIGFDTVIETSALSGMNVAGLFDIVVEMCKDRPTFVQPSFSVTNA